MFLVRENEIKVWMLLWFHHALFYRVLSILSPTQIIACFKIFFLLFFPLTNLAVKIFQSFLWMENKYSLMVSGGCTLYPQFIKDQIPGMTFRVLAIYSKEGDVRVDTKTFL